MNGFLLYTELVSKIIASVSYIGGMIGLFISIRNYIENKKKERLQREYGTYDELDNKYIEFMYTCAAHPKLDLLSEPISGPRALSEEELRMERALFAVLISLFERVFVMFQHRLNDKIYDSQYPGWIACMESYCTRSSFLAEWEIIGKQFDEDFYDMMCNLINKSKIIDS